MMQICQKEGLQVNESTLEALSEGANADIRLILGQLQMIRLSSRKLSYDDVKVTITVANMSYRVMLPGSLHGLCTLLYIAVDY